jgi:hypothetical protein
MDAVLELEAEISERRGAAYWLEYRLSAGGKLRVVGKVEALPVSAT